MRSFRFVVKRRIFRLMLLSAMLLFVAPLWGQEKPVPQILSSFPAQGASEVSPSIGVLRLIFNVPMDTTSWTLWKAPEASGDVPPLESPGKNPWLDDKICEFAIGPLEENTTYALQCNAPGYEGFRSSQGVPMAVTLLVFTTQKKEKTERVSPPGISEKHFPPSLSGSWKTSLRNAPMKIVFSPDGTFRYTFEGREGQRGTYHRSESSGGW